MSSRYSESNFDSEDEVDFDQLIAEKPPAEAPSESRAEPPQEPKKKHKEVFWFAKYVFRAKSQRSTRKKSLQSLRPRNQPWTRRKMNPKRRRQKPKIPRKKKRSLRLMLS